MNRDQAKHCIHVVSFNSFNHPLRSELLRCHLRKLRLTESKVSTVPQCVRNRVRFLAPCRAQVFLGHSASSPYTVTEAEAQGCWLSPKSHSKKQAREPRSIPRVLSWKGLLHLSSLPCHPVWECPLHHSGQVGVQFHPGGPQHRYSLPP